MKNRYTFSEIISTGLALIRTKLFYPGARLVRFPFYVRGKRCLQYGVGFTTGHNCRFDLQGEKKTLLIGNHCQIGDNVHIVAHQQVVLGDHCLLASKIFISDTNHGHYRGEHQSLPTEPPQSRSLFSEEVIIGDNVWIGENVCILPGVHIGSGAIIGANAVVNKDLPPSVIAVGSPAKAVKIFDETTSQWKNN